MPTTPGIPLRLHLGQGQLAGVVQGGAAVGDDDRAPAAGELLAQSPGGCGHDVGDGCGVVEAGYADQQVGLADAADQFPGDGAQGLHVVHRRTSWQGIMKRSYHDEALLAKRRSRPAKKSCAGLDT